MPADEPTGRPLLVVEVISRWSRPNDTVRKRRLYAEGGVPAYWIVDPAAVSLTVLRLGQTGQYVEQAHVAGGDSIAVDFLFPLRLCPAALLAG